MGANGNFTHCWWEHKLVQTLKNYLAVSTKADPSNPVIPLLGI